MKMMRTDRQWETLAGEYVIGTMSAREQKIYDNILRHDVDFRERVGRWQTVFSPLDSMLEPVAPDERVWQQIADTLSFTQARTAKTATPEPLADTTLDLTLDSTADATAVETKGSAAVATSAVPRFRCRGGVFLPHVTLDPTVALMTADEGNDEVHHRVG